MENYYTKKEIKEREREIDPNSINIWESKNKIELEINLRAIAKWLIFLKKRKREREREREECGYIKKLHTWLHI